jgi:RHS repeat-associated protein
MANLKHPIPAIQPIRHCYYCAGCAGITLREQTSSQNDVYYSHADHYCVGGAPLTADASGNVMLAKSYEPQGSATSIFGFTGEQMDSSTQLVFLRAWYMQPRLGMFLSRDPAGPVGEETGTRALHPASKMQVMMAATDRLWRSR